MAFLNWLFVALLCPARIDEPQGLPDIPLVKYLIENVLVQHVRDDPGHSTRARFLLLFSTSEMSRQLPILHTTYQDESLRGAAADVSRRAVRGLIVRDGKILTVYSEVNGDYKFPGGGVEEGESDTDALARELSEECGYGLVRLGGKFAVVAEYKDAMEADAAVFRMDSHYYFAEIDAGQWEQLLDDYEQQLRFRPAWVTIDQALQRNRLVIERSAAVPSWTARETWVLRALAAYGTENALPYAPPSDRAIISECHELD